MDARVPIVISQPVSLFFRPRRHIPPGDKLGPNTAICCHNPAADFPSPLAASETIATIPMSRSTRGCSISLKESKGYSKSGNTFSWSSPQYAYSPYDIQTYFAIFRYYDRPDNPWLGHYDMASLSAVNAEPISLEDGYLGLPVSWREPGHSPGSPDREGHLSYFLGEAIGEAYHVAARIHFPQTLGEVYLFQNRIR